MKFNSIGSSSNFAQAGKATADEFVRIHAAARANAPDMGKIVENAATRKSQEKIAATKAQTEVARVGIATKGKVKAHKIENQAMMKRDKERRKAGALATAGKLFASAGSYLGEKRTKREVGAEDSWYDQQISRAGSSFEKYKALLEDMNSDTPSTSSSTPDSGSVETPSGNNSTDSTSSSTTKPDTPISSFQSTGKKGKWTVGDMTRIAEQAGFSPQQAKIMGAIGMAESGGNPTIDTVQSGLDPGKKGEYSIGLFQVNAQAHGDKLRKLGYTEDDLRDPVKAAQVAKMVYDEVGSFKPWSVYKSGAYSQYMQ